MYMNVLLCMFFNDHVFKIIINCMYHVALDKYKLNQKIVKIVQVLNGNRISIWWDRSKCLIYYIKHATPTVPYYYYSHNVLLVTK